MYSMRASITSPSLITANCYWVSGEEFIGLSHSVLYLAQGCSFWTAIECACVVVSCTLSCMNLNALEFITCGYMHGYFIIANIIVMPSSLVCLIRFCIC